MAAKNQEMNAAPTIGWVYLACFAVLIATGIIVKRVYHHPEFIMFFHLPAAVFLVLAGYKLPRKLHEHYRKDCQL
jgi:hypothetical protein